MSSAEKRAKLLSGLLAQRGEAAPAPVQTPPARPSEVIRFNERRSEIAASVLYSKGNATAETFRPAQWTFEKETQPAAPQRGKSVTLIAVLGCLALVVSGGLFVMSRIEPGMVAPAPVADSAPHTATIAVPAPTPTPAPVPAPMPRAAAAVAPAPAAAPTSAPRAESPMPAAPAEPVATSAPAAAPVPAPEPAPAAVAPQPEAAAPVVVAAAPAPQPAAVETPAPARDPQAIAGLIGRGDELLGTGDIVSARLFYQRAAELGSGPAATAVGQTYDPLFLEVARVRGVRGDPLTAAQWYRKAIALGDRGAEIRLRRLEAKPPG